MKTLKAFSQYAYPVRHILFLGALCASLAAVAGLTQPILMQALLDLHASWDSRVTNAIFMVTAVVFSALFTAGSTYAQSLAGQGIIKEARNGVIDHAAKVEGGRLNGISGSRLTTLVVSDATLLESGVTSSLIQVASAATMLLGSVAVLQHLYAPLVWSIVISSVLGVAIIAVGSPFLQRRRRVVQQRTANLIEDLTGTFDKLRVLRVYGVTKHHVDRLIARVNSVADASARVSRVQSTIGPMASLAFQCGACSAAVIGSFAVHHGTIQPGDIAAVMMLGGMISSPMQALIGVVIALQSAAVALERIETLTSEPREIRRFVPLASPPDALPTRPKLCSHQLTFAYGSNPPTLKDLSFDTREAGLVAVVGGSGAGKSTLLSILSGLVPADTGTLHLNDAALAPGTMETWRSNVAFVDQDASVLSGSLRSNVDLAHRLPDAEVQFLLGQLGLQPKLDALPQGLDTHVNWNAHDFSGGERQRIALARAIASNRPLILLDEPTSALDASSERLAISALTSLRDRLTVCVTHRLSLAEVADTIIVLKDGVVAETGPHHELVRRDGEYAKLWNAWCGSAAGAAWNGSHEAGHRTVPSIARPGPIAATA